MYDSPVCKTKDFEKIDATTDYMVSNSSTNSIYFRYDWHDQGPSRFEINNG